MCATFPLAWLGLVALHWHDHPFPSSPYSKTTLSVRTSQTCGTHENRHTCQVRNHTNTSNTSNTLKTQKRQ